MPDEIRIYFEGDKSLRPGFAAFFKQITNAAKTAKVRVELVATGGNPEHDFAIARRKHPAAWNILLRDSEGPHNPAADAESVFWMVEMMESSFHADTDALARYYGPNFHRNALRANPKVEEIPKKDLIDELHAATKNTIKGQYHKTRHAPRLLELIDPAKVRRAAPHCDVLFESVLAGL